MFSFNVPYGIHSRNLPQNMFSFCDIRNTKKVVICSKLRSYYGTRRKATCIAINEIVVPSGCYLLHHVLLHRRPRTLFMEHRLIKQLVSSGLSFHHSLMDWIYFYFLIFDACDICHLVAQLLNGHADYLIALHGWPSLHRLFGASIGSSTRTNKVSAGVVILFLY